MKVAVRWSGGDPSTFEVDVNGDATVCELKRAIELRTSVKSSRVKLLNVRAGAKLASDEDTLTTLKMPKTVMMMGVRESALAAMRESEAVAEANAPEMEDDLDETSSREVAASCATDERFLAKLRNRIASASMKVLREPRVGAKCLVLDIDYTLFDHRTTAETPEEIMRQHLHEFLTRAYEAGYDLVIWSATSLKWIELKMTELGVLTSESFKVVGLIDSTAMITVETAKYGLFNCKPLGFLFAKLPQYTPKNTLMFDDLSRNFVMNPQLGLKIRPFRNAHTHRATDRELLGLARYVEAISKLEDFSGLNHNRWESYLAKRDRNDDANDRAS